MEENTPISFSAYTGVQTQTRSTETTLGGMKTDGFGIIAYMTKGDYGTDATTQQLFMENQQVTYDVDASTPGWTYTPAKYWPNNGTDKLSFFAYTPYDGDASKGITVKDDSGTPTLTLSAANPLTTPDLVLANDATAQLNLTKANGKVTFPFKHVLTRVRMQAKTAVEVDASTTKVCITKIELVGSKLARQRR